MDEQMTTTLVRKRKSKLKYTDEETPQVESWIAKRQTVLPAVLAERRMYAYDSLYQFIANRDSTERVRFIAGIEAYYRAFFHAELNNVNDPRFHDQFDEFFHTTRLDTREARILQMFIIYTSLVLSAKIRRYLCPVPPAPDSCDVDRSHVDRVTFAKFEGLYLLPMYFDLLDGTTLTVHRFTAELNALYAAMLPANPIDAIRRNNFRQVVLPLE